MALSIQASTPVSTSLNTFSVTLPASVIAGDLLILIVEISSVFGACTATGYTQIHNNTGAGDDFYVFTKTAGSSETSPSVTTAGGAKVAVIIRVRDWDTGTGPAQLTAQASNTTTASIDPPTVGSAKIGVVHADPTVSGGGMAATWTTATEIAELENTGQAFISVAYKMEDTAGALAYTHTDSGTPANLIFSIAPAAGVAFVPQVTIL